MWPSIRHEICIAFTLKWKIVKVLQQQVSSIFYFDDSQESIFTGNTETTLVRISKTQSNQTYRQVTSELIIDDSS